LPREQRGLADSGQLVERLALAGEDDPEKHHHGRFNEGEERLGEDDPERHHHGRTAPPRP
jgi:hypothetical protein